MVVIPFQKETMQNSYKMKTTLKIFSFFFAIALFVACAAGESEILKQARTIQEGMVKQKNQLDSTLKSSVEGINSKLSILSNDTVAMKDSANIASFNEMRTRVEELNAYRTQLDNWMAGAKLLPSLEDIKKGIENPFGKDAKDEDILNSIKKSQSELSDMKSEIETAMQ
jgi:outer membrane murein-binding lipoprotein Lpp